ncbi:hypothetical protein CEXT_156211 [Caerostris extrusa]|uniref:Uncharacterized protein n=1 Tax=Caerostris extrusa TaxID=172846 RepID=A0AAV4Y6C1_CAEEX|nr:hypothetical protein CEXT_156211 [Caerostris extrusa]
MTLYQSNIVGLNREENRIIPGLVPQKMSFDEKCVFYRRERTEIVHHLLFFFFGDVVHSGNFLASKDKNGAEGDALGKSPDQECSWRRRRAKDNGFSCFRRINVFPP